MVKGKIFAGWRFWFRLITYSLLALGTVDYFWVHPAQITQNDLSPIPSQIEDLVHRLRVHVDYLASPNLMGRKAGTPGNKLAERYLLEQFKKLRLSTPAPENRRTQEVSPAIGNNVFSALTPIHPKRKWLVLAAHFDHLGEEKGAVFLGADDNASSVAILLETARLLQRPPSLNQYNVLVVGFNSEEPPHIRTPWMGSNQFIMRIGETGLARSQIKMAVVMDLMGGVHWKPLQNSVFAIGAEKTPRLENVLGKIQTPGLEVRPLGIHMVESVPGMHPTPFSDYDAFRNHKIPFLFLSSGRTRHYHRSSDTSEKLHYARMARSAIWLAKLIRAVDALPTPLEFFPERENYLRDLQTLYPIIQKAAQWKGKIPQTSWVSLYKFNRDKKRLEQLNAQVSSNISLTNKDGRDLSLASIRLQCLLGNMGPCFLLPSP